jgi:ribosomal protein S18 acetylase RimI-like enzyme
METLSDAGSTGKSLYRVTRADCARAAMVLADAFAQDPVWNRVFDGEQNPERKRRAFFETPVRLSLKYGAVIATSPRLEGIAAWVPGPYADMGIGRLVRSGALGCVLGVGPRVARRLARSFSKVGMDRTRHMAGREYTYLQIIGVASSEQGKGYGGQLLRHLIELCDHDGRAIYLETETERNVAMYRRFGFELLDRIELRDLGLPLWEMARDPAHAPRPRS